MKNQTELQNIYRAADIPFELNVCPDFPGPVYTMQIPGGDAAIEIWQKIRNLHAETSYWPLVTVNDWYRESDEELASAQWLAEASHIDALQWFEERQDNLPDPEEQAEEWREMMEEMGIEPGQIQENPADAAQTNRFVSLYDLFTQEPIAELLLTLVPVDFSWQAAAFLGFGGWNACPEPAEQLAIQKYWHERYRVEPVIMTHDVLEMKVLNPPQSDQEALVLAQEQYLFCDDIVEQGCITIENLKQAVLKSPHWYFWWD